MSDPVDRDETSEMAALREEYLRELVNLEAKFQKRIDEIEKSASAASGQETKSRNTGLIRKEFRIVGQIGDSRQKDRLRFTSLIHQVSAGEKAGYGEREIIEAVIRATIPSLSLRSFLENKDDLSLATLKRVLR